MNRRRFTFAALLAPLVALPALAEAAPRRKLAERSWAEMTARQHTRLLPGFGTPAPTEADAGPRWDAMTPTQRRRLVVATRRHRAHPATPPA